MDELDEKQYEEIGRWNAATGVYEMILSFFIVAILLTIFGADPAWAGVFAAIVSFFAAMPIIAFPFALMIVKRRKARRQNV